VEATRDVRSEIFRTVVKSGAELLSLTDSRPTLDDVYARYFERVRTDPEPSPEVDQE